jgi:curli biogenesis system outer membrane secretion channel CsgG
MAGTTKRTGRATIRVALAASGLAAAAGLVGAGVLGGPAARAATTDLGGAAGYAFNVTDQSNCSANPNRVYASNTVANASKGLTNIPVTPGG